LACKYFILLDAYQPKVYKLDFFDSLKAQHHPNAQLKLERQGPELDFHKIIDMTLPPEVEILDCTSEENFS
jgi:hypothetical protein